MVLDFERAAPVYYMEELLSSNDRLREMAEAGAAAGTALAAGRQSGGRGRQGRSFVSPEGGLYFSLLLRPDCEPEQCSSLTALAALVMAKTLEDDCGIRPGIKWPNDLMLEGKKLCGILTEMKLREGRPEVILGVGLNLNSLPEDFPPELQEILCSVRGETGRETPWKELLARLLQNWDAAYERWQEETGFFLEEYRDRSLCPGREVLVLHRGKHRHAMALAISPDFSLRLQYADGQEEDLFYGEVSLRISQ